MKKPIGSKTAVTLWLSMGILMLWLAAMTALTIVSAHQCKDARDYSHRTYYYRTDIPDWFSEDRGSVPNYWLFSDFDVMGNCSHIDSLPNSCQTASILMDPQGNVEMQTGTFFYGSYHTEESWLAGADLERDGTAQIFFQPDRLPDEIRENLNHDTSFTYFVMRYTGVLNGNRMQASKIEYIDYDEFTEREMAHYHGEYSYVVSQEVQKFDLPWHTLYEDPSVEGDMTIYSTNPRISLYNQVQPVQIGGREYNTLLDFLLTHKEAALKPDDRTLYEWEERHNDLLHSLQIDVRNIYQADSLGDENPQAAYYFLTATSYSPILTAMEALVKVYIWSFALALVLLLVLRRVLILNLVIPMKSVNEAADQDWKYLIYYNDHGAVWKEAVELEKHYHEARNYRIKTRDELFRLQAALDYAKTAEENRRRMTSAIAHEWKTPLAVIHSYAEGLKEHIAEDKRDHYLDVILSETETLDAMVLELLDLSRLEAGKVKLTRDEFSLSALTESILEKLQLKAQEKALTVETTLSGDCIITADEGRIAQVITNFLSNAIRYTPQGGSVSVKVFDDRLFAWFRVENDSQPFTEEELAKLWETFYRTDKARTGEGTGLGLAICKSIIDLHGGLCKAENTETGVAFWFRLKKA